jgi:hypothetical protein
VQVIPARWAAGLALALIGCGARDALLVEGTSSTRTTTTGTTSTGAGASTSSGGGAALGHFQASCAPNDGPAILLSVDGTTSCAPSATPVGALQFLVSGADLATLGSGAVLTLSADPKAPTQGWRVVPMGSPYVTPMTGGTLVFTGYLQGQSATGTYAVTFSDGSAAQGSFDAVGCPGGGQCG